MRSGGGRVDIDSEQKFAWEWYVNESPVENPMVKSPNFEKILFFLWHRAGWRAQDGADNQVLKKTKINPFKKKIE